MKKWLCLLPVIFLTFTAFGKTRLPATNTITADVNGVTTVFAVSPRAVKKSGTAVLHSVMLTASKNYTLPGVSLTITINSDWPIDKQTYTYSRANSTTSAIVEYSGDNDHASFAPDETRYSPVTVTITSIDNYSVEGTFSASLSSNYGKVEITNGHFSMRF